MIGYFPELYPDELLYSAIARYAARIRYPSDKILLRDLFGTDTVTAVIDLPTRIDALVSRLPALTGLTSDALINRHTLWPIYAPFQPPTRHQDIVRKMKGDGGGAVHVQAGIPAGRVHPPQFLRFCTECAVEDRQHHGEAYWHRVHQVSGIQACAKHQVLLQDSDVRRADRKARHVFVSADSSLPAAQPVRPQPDGTLVRLADSAAWLLDNPQVWSIKRLHRIYLELLAGRGLATCNGRVFLRELHEEFAGRHPATLLAQIQCEVPATTAGGWLTEIVHTPRKAVAPIRHLLFIDFLDETTRSIAARHFKMASGSDTRATNRWPCRNPVRSRFRADVIKTVHMRHSAEHNRTVCEFRCPHCGYTYVTLDGGKRSWVRDYGSHWRAALRECWMNPRMSLREIASILGADPVTVKRHAAKLNLPFPRTAARPTRTCDYRRRDRQAAHERQRTERREAWLAARSKCPTLGVKALRKCQPATYAWLYRHDREWLTQHSPPALDPRPQRARVDWAERDNLLAAKIQTFLGRQEVFSRDARLSVAAIGRATGAVAILQKHLAQLPMVRSLLAALQTTLPQ